MEKNEEQQPEKTDGKDSIMSKIQQLGETALPQMPQDTNIHCLTIIGQIEGHVQLPPQNNKIRACHPANRCNRAKPKDRRIADYLKYSRR